MNATKLFLASLLFATLSPIAMAQSAGATKLPTASLHVDAVATSPAPSDRYVAPQPAPIDVYLRKLDGGMKIETRRLDGEERDGFVVVCIDNGWFLWPVAVLCAQDESATTFKVELEDLAKQPIVLIAVQLRDDGLLDLSEPEAMSTLVAKIEA